MGKDQLRVRIGLLMKKRGRLLGKLEPSKRAGRKAVQKELERTETAIRGLLSKLAVPNKKLRERGVRRKRAARKVRWGRGR